MKTIQTELEQESQRQQPRIVNPVRNSAGRKKGKVKNRDMTCLNSRQSRESGNGAAAVKQKAPLKNFMKPKKLTPTPKLKLKENVESSDVSRMHEAVIRLVDEPAETDRKPGINDLHKRPVTVHWKIDEAAEIDLKSEFNDVRKNSEAMNQNVAEPTEKVFEPGVIEVCKRIEPIDQVIDKPGKTDHKPVVDNVCNRVIEKIVETYQRLKFGGLLLTQELENLLTKKQSQIESQRIEPPCV